MMARHRLCVPRWESPPHGTWPVMIRRHGLAGDLACHTWKAPARLRLLDHDQAVTVGAVVPDRYPEGMPGGHQRLRVCLVR